MAMILTVNVLCGSADPKSSIIKIAILTGICILGNFLTSYFEQINTLKSGFFMTADQRVAVASHLQKISMVFQRVYLFEDTSFNNIRFGKPDASLEDVRKAAKSAYCDDFIMALPDGYDTVLTEGGNSLFGGEKQRISIARAILKDSPTVILDETTSALDAENEHEILGAIDMLTKNKTVIMIAHRIKSVERADHIIALKNSRVVQEGTHAELKNTPGLYADFLASREEATLWQLNT